MNINTPTFLFYDYETFGAVPSRDKPCQFAGIRTDHDFNVIGEPIVIFCKPTDDYLPQPEACLITGITPQKAMQEGLAEPEFITQIHQLFSQPNTCVIGYNNIRFDDEVTRYTLYRNFFDPYAWSWQHNNSRWDLLDPLRAAHALRPEGIEWPENQEGFTSFRLEDLSKANGISHENAHDALADVYATIEMTKKLKQAQPKLFHYLFTHRNKKTLSDLIDFTNMKPLVHVSGMFGVARQNISVIAPIAFHPENPNAVIVVDLNKDISPLFDLTYEQIKTRLYTKHADLAPDELPIPLKLIHLNKCPVLAVESVLRPEDAARVDISPEFYRSNVQRLRANPEIREKLHSVFLSPQEKPNVADENVDASLYHGFFSNSDRHTLDRLRQTAPEKLADPNFQFEDKRIPALLFQYRARHFPHTLSEQEQTQWALRKRDYFESQLHEYVIKLENLYAQYQHDTKKLAILQSVQRYVESLIA